MNYNDRNFYWHSVYQTTHKWLFNGLVAFTRFQMNYALTFLQICYETPGMASAFGHLCAKILFGVFDLDFL